MPVTIKIELRFDSIDEAQEFSGRFNDARADDLHAARMRRIEETGRPLLDFLELELEKKGLSPAAPTRVTRES